MEITAAVANATSKNLAFCILITFQIFLQKEEYKIVEMMKQSQHHKSVTYCFSGKQETKFGRKVRSKLNNALLY